MTTEQVKDQLIGWLHNGQELDIANMASTLRPLGLRLVSWHRNGVGYRISLEANVVQASEMIGALEAWIRQEWIWAGHHVIQATGDWLPGREANEPPCMARYYDIEIVQVAGEEVFFQVNEKSALPSWHDLPRHVRTMLAV